MTENYLNILAETIRTNWDQPALTDFYLTEDGSAQDTSRGNHYTYGEMYAEICRIADLLTALGLQKGDHVAICGANSAHWVIAYLAIAKMQGVSVTVMHTLMPEEIARLVDFSDAKALFTDEDIWAELKSQPMPQVGNVIGLENWQILRGDKIQISNLQSSISNFDCGFPQSNPDSLAMICFTSGTSGKSKGVMLSYNNLTVNISFIFDELRVAQKENITSILPLSHIYGIYNEALRPLCIGCHIFMIRAALDQKSLFLCFSIIRPFFAVFVPKIIESIINSLKANSKSNLRGELINLFGGNIWEFSIGGAGLSREVEGILLENRIPMGKGYGMTECAPLISVAITRGNRYKIGSVGKVVPTLTARISPAGEILVKGENVMLGYYKNPEATARKIDKDGWLHTGDKGHLDEDGYLYVEGRLEQDIIVLPNGENIRPDNIESLINALPEVSESIVHARDGKLVAIVVPQITNHKSQITNTDLRRMVLRTINPQLPLYSQLYDVEITDVPLQRTEKQTIKRYLYK